MASFGRLADWLGSDKASELLQVLIGAEPAAFLDTEPELAGEVVGWFTRRRRINRFEARDLARPLVTTLEARHADLWV